MSKVKPNKNNFIYIAGGNNIYLYEIGIGICTKVFSVSLAETMMGLCRVGNVLYAGAKTKIFKFIILNNGTIKIAKRFTAPGNFPAFHQISYNNKDGFLYVTCTQINQIWRLTKDLKLKRKFTINPPTIGDTVVYKKNYNHLNNVFFDGDKAYVCLNWLTTTQFGYSGVAVIDSTTMKELDRFEYGWESHNFCMIEGKKYSLCGSSKAIKEVHHPHKAGLMVDGELVFEHDADTYFCKDFSVDDFFIYLVGGEVKTRNKRKIANGKLYILDRKFNLVFENEFDNTGGFCGCLLNNIDYTKYIGGKFA